MLIPAPFCGSLVESPAVPVSACPLLCAICGVRKGNIW